jgi:predicted esterase
MRFHVMAALAAMFVFGGYVATGSVRTASAMPMQAVSFDEASKQFREAVEAKEFKKLPKLSEQLAKTKNPAAIPLMIGAIESEGTLDTIYNIGFFGLATITGVRYEESHDGTWWRNWWAGNKDKYPAAKDVAIAEFKGFIARPSVRIPDAPDVSSVKSQAHFAGGNRNMLYVTGGPTGPAPDGGYKVLLVLPGGDGSIDFHTFIKRIQINALGDSYIVAHLVAPKYAGSKDVVWPIKASQSSYQSPVITEDFVEAVVADVKKNHKVDAKKVYALGWSSSGPALYSYISNKPRSVTGVFVAMSVYHAQDMGPLENVKGFPVYILHSPDDKVCPLMLAQKARTELSNAGANVGWGTYSGGHGWTDDPYGRIRAGMAFLEGG